MAPAQRSGLGLGSRACPTLSSGGPPGAHPRGVPCPFCSSAYRVTYTVPSVPGALPFHLLLPHARLLHIVPQASEASQAASPPHGDSGGPQALGSLWLRRRASRGGAGRALFATPFPQSPPSRYQSWGTVVLSPHNQDPHLQIKGSEGGRSWKAARH